MTARKDEHMEAKLQRSARRFAKPFVVNAMGIVPSGFRMIGEFKGQYYFLSNFYPCTILYKGITFPTAEHAFQAVKTSNPDEMAWVAQASTPGKAKYRGRQVMLRPDWDYARLKEMFNILTIKFTGDLMSQLRATDSHQLVEGNYWHDQFWGSCLCARHVNIDGYNYLGKLLMHIRNS